MCGGSAGDGQQRHRRGSRYDRRWCLRTLPQDKQQTVECVILALRAAELSEHALVPGVGYVLSSG
jgi:hypothetical protein